MDAIARHRCQVRLLDGAGAPVGCGFIVSSSNVLTCTHVVESCLGRAPVFGDIVDATFPADIEGHRAKLVVQAAYAADPPEGADEQARICRDICVLGLAPDQVFPAGFSVAHSRLVQLAESLKFVGVGVTEMRAPSSFGRIVRREGVQISGDTGEYDGVNRLFATSLLEEKSIRSGCSGAAIFNPEFGLIGMVTENQEKVTGLIVPIQILRRVTEIQGVAVAGSDRSWLRRFRKFDRTQPVSDFGTLLRKHWLGDGRGFICAIGGVPRDDTSNCRDRFAERYLADCFPDLAGKETLPDLIDLEWPTTLQSFNVEQRYERLCNNLAGQFGADTSDPTTVREAFNQTNVATMFFSVLDVRNAKGAQLELLRRWGRYFAEINAKRLVRPLIHVFQIEIDEGLFAPGSPEPEAEVRKAYERLCDAVNADLPDAGQLRATELLEFFRPDAVTRWIKNTGRLMALDDVKIGMVTDSADRALGGRAHLRLEDVAQWVRQMAP
ncbi:S1 family peptidase [Sphingomonas psychrotolerans]|uniref:Trypsin-like peptidase domain-containing protein n=1 Tax=Sphingomonas psychrotolerans TaxID=1327635 RepID=A0A2K8MLA1_9SPHN|nr:serine protease [Sphingomonas psychrotolerans]ATY32529.1 hypothetical protein CVN68_11550 [Sphingomonas psychrotolerans]